jgi:hypothetical protein
LVDALVDAFVEFTDIVEEFIAGDAGVTLAGFFLEATAFLVVEADGGFKGSDGFLFHLGDAAGGFEAVGDTVEHCDDFADAIFDAFIEADHVVGEFGGAFLAVAEVSLELFDAGGDFLGGAVFDDGDFFDGFGGFLGEGREGETEEEDERSEEEGMGFHGRIVVLMCFGQFVMEPAGFNSMGEGFGEGNGRVGKQLRMFEGAEECQTDWYTMVFWGFRGVLATRKLAQDDNVGVAGNKRLMGDVLGGRIWTMKNSLLILVTLFLGLVIGATAEEKLKVLLIDGQNNHAWAETSPVLVSILEESGRFDVDVSTTPAGPPKAPRKPKGRDEKQLAAFNEAMKKWMEESEQLKKDSVVAWEAWRPTFSEYDVVVSNYNGELWPEEVRTAFEDYVRGGGGFVAVHAADNSHPAWADKTKMMARGGGGGRNEMSGPYLRLRDGVFVKDKTPGGGGAHGQKHEFQVVTREADHPIVKGLPAAWMHATDELYGKLRGPAEKVTVLASAFSDEALGGSGEEEPILMVISYGDGRVFHTTLGHDTTSMSGVGFQESLARGVEWVATGEVTFEEVTAEELPAEGEAAVR